jgi:hypothetical protein
MPQHLYSTTSTQTIIQKTYFIFKYLSNLLKTIPALLSILNPPSMLHYHPMTIKVSPKINKYMIRNTIINLLPTLLRSAKSDPL